MSKIDNNLFVYWEGPQPDYIRLCIDTMKAHAQGSLDVYEVNREMFDTLYAADLDADKSINFDWLTPVQRSDFIRVYLLQRFGGTYLDADCIAMHSLNPLIENAEQTGFCVAEQRDNEPQLNFVISAARHPVITDVYNRILDILRKGPQPDLAWLALGTHVLIPAIEANPETVTWIPAESVTPIHWPDQALFFERTTDGAHAANLDRDAFCYMMSNDTITKDPVLSDFRSMSRAEILAGDRFLSYLFRTSLEPKMVPPPPRPLRDRRPLQM